MNRKHLEEIVISFSFFNLLFLPAWRRLIYPSSAPYNIINNPTPIDFWGMLATVSFLSLTAFLVYALSRHYFGEKVLRIARRVFLVLASFCALLVGIILFKSEFWIITYLGRNLVIFSALAVGIAGLVLGVLNPRPIIVAARAILLILSPLVIITFSQAFYKAVTFDYESRKSNTIDKRMAGIDRKTDVRKRVVWIVFDEMDYLVAFERRPSDLLLPEFDRLKSEAFFATNSISPDTQTQLSIPSLLTGKLVKNAVPQGENDLLLEVENSRQPELFSASPNIFRSLKQKDLNSGLVGWYHPYCRVIGQDLSFCSSETADVLVDFESRDIWDAVSTNFIVLFNSLPAELRAPFTNFKYYVQRHDRMVKSAKQLAENKEIDLAFIHLPMPHYPYRYDRKTGQFTGGEGYIDNLALSDKVLGEIRAAMEKAGTWDSTTVIVTSDHPWRLTGTYRSFLTKSDILISGDLQGNKIPFIVKLAGEKDGVDYNLPFNSVVTRDLISAIFDGKVSTIDQLVEWFNLNTKQ